MKRTVHTDATIIGGGIAGLWLLNALRRAGYGAARQQSAAERGAAFAGRGISRIPAHGSVQGRRLSA